MLAASDFFCQNGTAGIQPSEQNACLL